MQFNFITTTNYPNKIRELINTFILKLYTYLLTVHLICLKMNIMRINDRIVASKIAHSLCSHRCVVLFNCIKLCELPVFIELKKRKTKTTKESESERATKRKIWNHACTVYNVYVHRIIEIAQFCYSFSFLV